MQTKGFNKDVVRNEIAEFSGLSHIGNGMNRDIDNYFHSFMDWLDQNDVLGIVNQFSNTPISLKGVNSQDFLIWLLHYGDVYDSFLRYCLEEHPALDYKRYAIEFFNLRQLHPKFSFVVALSSQMASNKFLSDNDIDDLTDLISAINKDARNYNESAIGNALFDSLLKLSKFEEERVSKVN